VICSHCRRAVIFLGQPLVVIRGIGYLRQAVHEEGREEACPNGEHVAAPYDLTPVQEAA
jgi:hypothetical protein